MSQFFNGYVKFWEVYKVHYGSVFIHFIFVSFLTSTLPIPDTKGISSSLSILTKCLQQMTLTEYFPLAQMYGLSASHPLLQSYYCSYEAAFRSQYTPLFYARHKVSDLHKSLACIYWKQRKGLHKNLIRKEFYSQRICLEHQHGRHNALEHQHGRHVVMWKPALHFPHEISRNLPRCLFINYSHVCTRIRRNLKKKNSSQEYFHMTSLRIQNVEAKEVHSLV